SQAERSIGVGLGRLAPHARRRARDGLIRLLVHHNAGNAGRATAAAAAAAPTASTAAHQPQTETYHGKNCRKEPRPPIPLHLKKPSLSCARGRCPKGCARSHGACYGL